MRKVLTLFLLFLTLALFKPNRVDAEVSGVLNVYEIRRFQSEIVVAKDTSLEVSETIVVNFPDERHGLIRVIPYIYSARGKTIKAGFDLTSITDELGNPYKYSIRNYRQSKEIKIGDANVTLHGEKIYVIKYRISNVVQRYADYDEVFWNVTGHEQDTDIIETSAIVRSDYAEITKTDCFSGLVDSQQRLCDFRLSSGEADFVSTTQLGPGKDLTIIVGLAKDNQLAFPGSVTNASNFVFWNWGYLLALAPLLTMAVFWNKKGRDQKYSSENIYYKPDKVEVETVALFARRHIPLVYHPLDGLTPSEVGTISDEKVDTHDVVSEMIELARLGYIRLERFKIKKLFKDEEEYAFVKLDKAEDAAERAKLKGYQDYLLKEIFRSTNIHRSVAIAEKNFKNKPKELDRVEKLLVKKDYVLLSALKNHFYEGLSEYKDKVYKEMELDGFFFGDPESVRKKWIALYMLAVFIGFFITMQFCISTANYGPIVVFPITAAIGVIFALNMPRRTPKGYSLFRQIEGLKWYLTKGEWRYENMEKNLFFEEILPLAIALKVVNKISADMKEIGIEPPRYMGGFTTSTFSTDFGRFYALSGASLVSVPSGTKWSGAAGWSGGSGFSGGSVGGGFGGGGGGSW